MIFRGNRKNWRNVAVWRKKVMLERNQGLRHREGGRYKQALLLSNDENHVNSKNILSYFQCLSSKFEVYVTRFQTKQININFLSPNAELLKISVLIFFCGTYLQKPHCLTIETISSNKTQLPLRFVLKSKDLKSQVRRINSKLILLYQLI